LQTDDRIIIAGAGPVGLVAAMLLAEAKIPVTIVEAEDDISDDLRASTFHPPTLDMLDAYGVTGQLLAEGTPEQIKNDQRVVDAYLGAQ